MNSPPEPDWSSVDEPDPTDEYFKWGWNRETGKATVWTVAGGLDGPPFHDDEFERVFGRAPRPADGDVLGNASRLGASLLIYSYYDDQIPPEVIGWFRSAYPNAELHLDSP